MKRGIFTLIFLVLLIGLVSADIVGQDADVVPIDSGNAGVSDAASGFRASSNQVMNYDVQIPSELKAFSAIFLGIGNYNISVSQFITLLCIWFMFLILLRSILDFVPLFGEDWKAWIASIIISCLVGITGVFVKVGEFFFDFKKSITFLKDYDLFYLLIVLIIMTLLFFGFYNLMSMLKKESRKDKARSEGYEEGASAARAETMAKALIKGMGKK